MSKWESADYNSKNKNSARDYSRKLLRSIKDLIGHLNDSPGLAQPPALPAISLEPSIIAMRTYQGRTRVL